MLEQIAELLLIIALVLFFQYMVAYGVLLQDYYSDLRQYIEWLKGDIYYKSVENWRRVVVNNCISEVKEKPQKIKILQVAKLLFFLKT